MKKRGAAAIVGVVAAGSIGLVPVALSGAAAADPTVITVTTTSQAIGGAGCSLGEAILAANHDATVVPDPIGNGAVIDTGCAAGSGADLIELQPGATYSMANVVDDDDNYTGPTATPLVTTSIIIEGRGAVLTHTGTAALRAFAVGPTGHLDLREVHVRNFLAEGGSGRHGGGGGLGAGGAIATQARRTEPHTKEAQ